MITRAMFEFLDELAANNNRQWFEANKDRYEALVRSPALRLIADMGPELEKFAPHFRADPRKMGGSLMRVYRDTRFSRNKTPYKTNVGIQFRHELGKDVHAPGFYLHMAVDDCFLAVGCWRPEAGTLWKIRSRIAEKPADWFAAIGEKAFADRWPLCGESLSRPPRGFATDHVAVEDIKRKDFLALLPLSRDEIIAPGLVGRLSREFSRTTPLMRFLCRATGVQY